MKKKILTSMWMLALLLGCYNSTVKNSYDVQGTVVYNNTPIEGVTCVLKSYQYGSYTTTSDATGVFSFSDIWSGTYTLSVEKAGYIITPSTVTITVENGNVTVDNFITCYTWETSFGYSLNEKAEAFIPDGSGGWITAGSTTSEGAGNCDGYIAHFDAKGNLLWDKTYGGDGYDILSSIYKTSDGGYIATGSSESTTDGKSSIWVIKITSDGNLDLSFGSSGELLIASGSDAFGNAVIQSSSGNYIVGGTVNSWNNADQLSVFFVASISSSGAVVWERVYGAPQLWQQAYALCEGCTAAGVSDGYILAGTRETSLGNYDISVMKIPLDGSASLRWEKIIDYGADDEARGVSVLANMNIAVTGYITSTNGSTDIWTGIFSPDGALTKEIVSGGSSDDRGKAVLPLTDGRFLISGTSVNTDQNRGDTDYYLAMCSADGSVTWEKRYDRGAHTDDTAAGVIAVTDGYVLGGYSYSDATKDDLWFIKVSSDGTYEGE